MKIRIQIVTKLRNSNPTKELVATRGEDSIPLGCMYTFLDTIGTSHHAFMGEVSGNPRNSYIQEHLGRWVGLQLKIERNQNELWKRLKELSPQS